MSIGQAEQAVDSGEQAGERQGAGGERQGPDQPWDEGDSRVDPENALRTEGAGNLPMAALRGAFVDLRDRLPVKEQGTAAVGQRGWLY
jgi:hypothetical protein